MSSVEIEKVAYLKGKTRFFLVFRGIKPLKRGSHIKNASFPLGKRERQALSNAARERA